MMRKLILAAALVFCAAVPAAAQDEPTPGETEAIRELLEVSRTRENFIRGMELGMEMGGMMELTDELRQVVREVMDEHFRYEDMEGEFIRLYAELFTEEEIRALTAFYRTPAGARMVELTPELTAGIQKFTMERMTAAMPMLMERIMEAMEDEENKPGESSKS
jgi:uncharacterized protein